MIMSQPASSASATSWIKDLPKAPVPELKSTLQKYLASLKVVLHGSQYEETVKTVEAFEKDPESGPKLQKLLQEYAEKSDNWVTDFWLEDMYLANSLPLPVNSSPFCLFPRQSFGTTMEFIRFAAKVVQISLKLKEQIDNLDAVNRDSIRSIESSLLVLCLDDTVFQRSSSTKCRRRDSINMVRMETSFMAQQLMHGGGSNYFSANRYYDKFLQIVVAKDGICGIVFEHSASEGITLLRFADQLLAEIEKSHSARCNAVNDSNQSQPEHSIRVGVRTRKNFVASTAAAAAKKVHPLSWQVDKFISQAIEEALKKINRLTTDVDLVVLKFAEFGKNFIKTQNLSPDAFVQLALQLTYYKVHRATVSSYESASLRQFRAGRVDNIRSNTKEVVAWTKALCDEIPQIKDQHKIDLFHKAMRKQVEIAQYTVDGFGPDNHLLALRELAKRQGKEVPSLFREKAYKEYVNFKLSTSQLVYEKVALVGYGAVVPEGYGCSYKFNGDSIVFCITSFFSCPETGSSYFSASLEASLLQMRELCLKSNQPEKPLKQALVSTSNNLQKCDPLFTSDQAILAKESADDQPKSESKVLAENGMSFDQDEILKTQLNNLTHSLEAPRESEILQS